MMTEQGKQAVRRFTGWHMTAILVAFFAVVIVVNVTMARFAVGTFGGTVVDNSYVASQDYNRWLAEARQQDRLGWKAQVTLDGSRHVIVSLSGVPQGAAAVSLHVTHPLGRLQPIDMTFVPMGDGRYRSREALPAGRWYGALQVRHGKNVLKLVETLS